tara:strand:+ start:292 stop:570 length:279 start_codon:yes stop_codon:yes gene_type:complete
MEDSDFDLSFIIKLAEPLDLEHELFLEAETREIHKNKDIKFLQALSESLLRQNHQQQSFIANCLLEISDLKKKLEKEKEETVSNFIQKLFTK